jgi:peroxiredoxin
MFHLHELHEKYSDKGLVILGFNSSDDKQVALDFLRENSATFPNILDPSDAAKKVANQDYKCSGVPLNYIISKDGKIVDAWYGYGHTREQQVIEKLGMK